MPVDPRNKQINEYRIGNHVLVKQGNFSAIAVIVDNAAAGLGIKILDSNQVVICSQDQLDPVDLENILIRTGFFRIDNHEGYSFSNGTIELKDIRAAVYADNYAESPDQGSIPFPVENPGFFHEPEIPAGQLTELSRQIEDIYAAAIDTVPDPVIIAHLGYEVRLTGSHERIYPTPGYDQETEIYEGLRYLHALENLSADLLKENTLNLENYIADRIEFEKNRKIIFTDLRCEQPAGL